MWAEKPLFGRGRGDAAAAQGGAAGKGGGDQAVEQKLQGFESGPVGRARHRLQQRRQRPQSQFARGLRQAVVEAVAYHARPERLEPSWGIPGAVHIASILADNPDAPLGTEPTDEMSALPGSYLARLGVASQIPAWRELAKRMATKGEQGASLQ